MTYSSKSKLFIFAVILLITACAAKKTEVTFMNIEGINITKLAHDGVKIEYNSTIIYIDPFKLADSLDKADLILITHGHYDHCSREDVKKVANASTIIIAPPDCLSTLAGLELKGVQPIKPGNKLSVLGFIIEAVPAYNINKTFHSKEQEWVGYIINMNGKRIYHAGDTDRIPEMKNLTNIDVAFLPVSGKYVMTADEAALACSDIQPKIAIPMHYGSIIGTKSDAEQFKEKAMCNVVILDEGK
jgi:L-ascorbate metabolism protein UlaG (beta-lactamase superfamily)